MSPASQRSQVRTPRLILPQAVQARPSWFAHCHQLPRTMKRPCPPCDMQTEPRRTLAFRKASLAFIGYWPTLAHHFSQLCRTLRVFNVVRGLSGFSASARWELPRIKNKAVVNENPQDLSFDEQHKIEKPENFRILVQNQCHDMGSNACCAHCTWGTYGQSGHMPHFASFPKRKLAKTGEFIGSNMFQRYWNDSRKSWCGSFWLLGCHEGNSNAMEVPKLFQLFSLVSITVGGQGPFYWQRLSLGPCYTWAIFGLWGRKSEAERDDSIPGCWTHSGCPDLWGFGPQARKPGALVESSISIHGDEVMLMWWPVL